MDKVTLVDDQYGLGWCPDYPDFRDYTMETAVVAASLKETGLKKASKAPLKLPVSADLRPWCSPIENQGALGSCTANAGVGMVEYFERRAFGRHLDASRLFLYKATRNLLKWTGDTGAFLRSTMGALALFGVPPEEYWPYVIADFDKEPTAFLYAYAQSFQSLTYYRLDTPGLAKSDVLTNIKNHLNSGLPLMFGFTVYSSISQAGTTGKIPFPVVGEKIVGGHAIMAVGYDDAVTVTNTTNGSTVTGALLIRNSWGTGWGLNGYGYLPYDYLPSRRGR
ncbi:MAG: C1 family peptidase [Blastocatellia bacterium]